jgi:RHS repeat-associated protein
MTPTQCSAPNLSVSVNDSNQITNTGFSYDASGNLTNDGSNAYAWDAENRLKSAAGTSYTFDGDGMRVMKGTNDLYWFSAATGQHPLFGRTTSGGTYTDEFVHFNGAQVGYRDDATGNVYHYINDHIGSARVMTDSSGVTRFESDYYPHGGQRVITNTEDSLLKFQGRQRDTETGLDNARRMYSSNIARWLPTRTTIPKASDGKRVPQPASLNAYAPANNSPVNHNDVSGSVVIGFVPEGQLPPPGCLGTPSLDFFTETGDLLDTVTDCGDLELLAPGFGLKPLLFGSDCEDFVNVRANDINTKPGNGIKATTKLIESSTTNVKVTVQGVSAKARNVGADAIDIVAGPTLVKIPIRSPGLLAQGELTFNAHLSDFIDWTYSATCDGLPFTYSGPQFVFVHTK